MTKTQLYLISPPAFNLDDFAGQLQEALAGGPVASLQLRMKDAPDEEIIKAAEILMPICHACDVAFILNDRVDIAKKIGADGIHLGQGDINYGDARAIVGPDMAIGVTCKDSRHLSMIAAEQGADYVAFGAFFPTQTKKDAAPAHKEILSWWVELFEVPCVAIGGITVENAKELIDTGVDFLAVSGGIWNHKKGPKEAVRQFNILFSA
ncbi:Thiamin-phosphate pyrophosphorylase [hydrothermal vent metagenome]|uniref:thiamine phosphate synthase n=1 Tax=hydrothermal vent metagenome TaxID=652676 RepID=A0A3B1B8F9_9ZZZZ